MQKKLISLIGLILLLVLPNLSEAQLVIAPSQYVSSSGGTGPLHCLSDGTAALPCYTGSDVTSGIYFSSTSTLISANGVNTSTFSTSGFTEVGTISVNRSALGTTSTNGFISANTTAATSGVTVQISPRYLLRGNAWDTSASETVDFFLENLPATAATPTGTLKFGYSLNGAAATYPMTLTQNGNLTILNAMLSASTITGGNADQQSLTFLGSSRSRITSPADGQINFNNTAVTSGIGIDVNTDSVLKIRTRAQTGYATVDALGFSVSGTAGASCAVAIPAHITVVNGIVTVCN